MDSPCRAGPPAERNAETSAATALIAASSFDFMMTSVRAPPPQLPGECSEPPGSELAFSTLPRYYHAVRSPSVPFPGHNDDENFARREPGVDRHFWDPLADSPTRLPALTLLPTATQVTQNLHQLSCTEGVGLLMPGPLLPRWLARLAHPHRLRGFLARTLSLSPSPHLPSALQRLTRAN